MWVTSEAKPPAPNGELVMAGRRAQRTAVEALGIKPRGQRQAHTQPAQPGQACGVPHCGPAGQRPGARTTLKIQGAQLRQKQSAWVLGGCAWGRAWVLGVLGRPIQSIRATAKR